MIPGVLAKLDRAAEIATELQSDAKSWATSHAPSTVMEASADGWFTWYLEAGPLPPLSFAVRAGEVVHQLRSSLDHTAWAIASANGGASRNTQFPIGIDPTHYKKTAPRMVVGIPGEAVKVIVAAQPYEPSGELCLMALHALSNLDKHRLLYAAQTITVPSKASINFNSDPVTRGTLEVELASKETVVSSGRPWAVRARRDPGGGDPPDMSDGAITMDVDMWVHDIRFEGEHDRIRATLGTRALRECVDKVRRVISRFDPFL